MINIRAQSLKIVVFQCVTILSGFVLTPLLISGLGLEGFGTWSAIFALASALSMLDFGITNTSRNILTKTAANSGFESQSYRVELVRAVLSSGIVSLIYLFLVILFFVYIYYAPMKSVSGEGVFGLIVLLVWFSVRTLPNAIVPILISKGETGASYSWQMVNSMIFLLLIIVWSKYLQNTLTIALVALFFASAGILSYVRVWVVFLRKVSFDIFREIRDLKRGRLLFALNHMKRGKGFFILQICTIVVYLVSIPLVHYFEGPAQAAEYAVVIKYFSIIQLGFNSFLSPLWTASTIHYEAKNIDEIRIIFSKSTYVWFVFSAVGGGLYLMKDIFVGLWIGSDFVLDDELFFVCLLYIIVTNYNNIYRSFMNGVGKIRLQILMMILYSITFVPLILTFRYFEYENSVAKSMLVLSIITLLWEPLQFRKIISLGVEARMNSLWMK